VRTMSLSLVITIVLCACASATQDIIPFVGCPADGQMGYIAPPHGPPKTVQLHEIPAGAIAYYKGDPAPGVYAPRGWHCRVWYGSNGSLVLVTPSPIDTTDFMPPKLLGPGVDLVQRSAETSGRFDVASYGARLFPALLATFIEGVKKEGLVPDSEFDPRRYAKDSVKYLDTRVAEFITPPGVSGLGTANFLAPSQDAVHGIAVVAPDSTVPDLSVLSIRLGAGMSQLEAALLRLNRACMAATDSC